MSDLGCTQVFLKFMKFIGNLLCQLTRRFNDQTKRSTALTHSRRTSKCRITPRRRHTCHVSVSNGVFEWCSTKIKLHFCTLQYHCRIPTITSHLPFHITHSMRLPQ